MYKSLSILAFILALTVTPAVAQTTETDGEADAETTEGGSDESLGLAIGTPEGPQVGDTYTREEFTDWQLRCIKEESGDDPCQLYQLLRDETGNAVAEINIFALPAGQEAAAGATLVTPLETLLTQQVRLAIDSGEAKRYPFSFCTQIGCISRLGFTAEEVAGLRRGVSATVTIVPAAAPTDTVSLSMSLAGFTAGFAAVQALVAAE